MGRKQKMMAKTSDVREGSGKKQHKFHCIACRRVMIIERNWCRREGKGTGGPIRIDAKKQGGVTHM
jgi:hypothetical protein